VWQKDWSETGAIDLLTSAKIAELRARLPKEAFDPAPRKLLFMFAHLAVVLGCFVISGRVAVWLWFLPLGIVAGHSLAVIGLHAHELTHGIILRKQRAIKALEWLFWSLLFVSPTMWRRAHNQTHHTHYNTPQDCDRQFFQHEETPFRKWYVRLIYPNSETFPWNPLVWLYMTSYFFRNTIAVFYPKTKSPALLPNKPLYRPGDRGKILTDLAFILTVQAGLWAACSFKMPAYLGMAVVSQFTASVIVMGYIFTNHFLKPVEKETDALSGSTSVIVPAWADWLHAHFSYHTEHHFFPAMNSDYYPALSRLLQENYPERYHRIPFAQAWRRLWRQPPFVADPTNAPAGVPQRPRANTR
jgi:fatty acid desaturase